MTSVLAAGDHFVAPEVFVEALRDRAGEHELEFSTLKLPWPVEPFGPVGNVKEASGTEEQLLESLSGVQIAATQMAPFTADVLAKSPDLRFVGVCRGGPVNVDLQAATEAGVVVSYAPGRNAAAAAEFAVGLVLAALRRIPASDAELKSGNWRGDYYAYENAGIELEGSTVGLVGYGAIGRIVARVLAAFGAHVLVADPFVKPEDATADGVELVELEELLRRSSVVSLHARLTPETHHLLNADNLALLPEGAVLVNSARGGLLDYAPLPGLLKSGRLGALAVDVYDIEPPPRDWPLFDAPNVITTPHLAGATRQTAHRAADIVAGEVARFLAGERPRFVANPEVLDRIEGLRP
ncbi:D-3-phosphoglycerate dehydrogenase [Saccharopolyspora erythraea NRRL 2338]|uniref:D-3-phosphoglycerate dehydrogenase, putative n=2 Tax=Saccharopolyspora erythraea TaxID=1836 RepID=A4FK85_SACEN|nr:2-hydroxyacid dehydrogenase [Saccharopolyspora erythraea]EQD85257.1 2-hydroxyacid dehydrogenase [Saccharopolyspora erythraea D]PFG98098.1 D-3-phosphoglycerate dehydrogenase [Saccharopolyspora erythraea NRRL 2338]QRK88208.1 2-hydroxyacid dehydrogenase [Saccharopolyspora erythraea]CAM04460.1 D-3-phosphoglycerate dehydrogenase, putative [Saccharopolyspora erythraea NRRL 2338]